MSDTHTIWKQVLQVETTDPAAKVGFEREIELWYKEELLPRMEELFDRCAGPNTLLRTEKMEITITLPLSNHWKENLSDAVLRELDKNLQSLAPMRLSDLDASDNAYGINHPSFTDPRTHPAIAYWAEREQGSKKGGVVTSDAGNVFLYFIETGTLPWFGKRWSNEELAAQVRIISNPDFTSRLVGALASYPQALKRLIGQFGEDLLKDLLGGEYVYLLLEPFRYVLVSLKDPTLLFWSTVIQLSSTAGANENAVPYLISTLPKGYIETWWAQDASDQQKKKLLKALNINGRGEVLNILKAVERSPAPNAQFKQPRSVKEDIQEEGVYVDNAGMIILHPFLNPLFSALQYWNGKTFLSEDQHQRAVLLSQYMVYPGEDFPEHGLLLNKVLCGYDLDLTLPSKLDCTEEEILQTEELLNAVLQYWKLNGNQVCTTIENLRVSFLQRPGKLIRRPGEWLLMVEKKGYDIVLKGLPWSIGMIKHPWMQDMLKVEWA